MTMPNDSPFSMLATELESPPPYKKYCAKDRLWMVIDAHGDSVLWSDQEIAVDAAVAAMNAMHDPKCSYVQTTRSRYYTDYLIAALRCLDDDQLRKLAHEIMGRLAATRGVASDDANVSNVGASGAGSHCPHCGAYAFRCASDSFDPKCRITGMRFNKGDESITTA